MYSLKDKFDNLKEFINLLVYSSLINDDMNDGNLNTFIDKIKSKTDSINEYSDLYVYIWNNFAKIILPLFKTDDAKRKVRRIFRKLNN